MKSYKEGLNNYVTPVPVYHYDKMVTEHPVKTEKIGILTDS